MTHPHAHHLVQEIEHGQFNTAFPGSRAPPSLPL